MFKWPWVKTPRISIPALAQDPAPAKVEAPVVKTEALKTEIDASHDEQMSKMWPINYELDEMINSLKPIELSQHGIGNVLTQDHNYVAAENLTQPTANKNLTLSTRNYQNLQVKINMEKIGIFN